MPWNKKEGTCVKNCASGSNIWSDGHCIDVKNAHVIEKH